MNQRAKQKEERKGDIRAADKMTMGLEFAKSL
jgi:hypothetical protein